MFLATISKDHFRISNTSRPTSSLSAAVLLLLLVSLLNLTTSPDWRPLVARASAVSEQPANQAPSVPATASQQPNSPNADFQQLQQSSRASSPSSGAATSVSSSNSVAGSTAGGSANSQSATQRLPNINIYINKSEIKKLLGIDSRINYVTNGNINSYPFAFTIPLGYNQSDIIFTWQNLGQTNVNYSISLVIGNIKAVDPPLINITRSGLIPKHEQVFKITLPCSGRVTDEVDVQVLINIAGYVSDEEPLVAAASAMGEAPVLPAAGSPSLDQQALGAAGNSSGEPMQADQGEQKFRLVSHTLAIKRKKICTMHPLQVPARPPTQQPIQPQQPAWHQQQRASQQLQQQMRQIQRQEAIANKWAPHIAAHQQAAAPISADIQQAPFSNTNKSALGQNGLESAISSSPSSDFPEAGSAPPTPTLDGAGSSTASALDSQLEANTRKLELLNLIPPAGRQPPAPLQFGRRPPLEVPQPAPSSPLGFYPNWPGSRPAGQQHSAGAPATSADSQLNDIIMNTNSRQQHQQQQQAQLPGQLQASISNNPLLLTLIACSLLISIALIVVVVLGSSHRTLLDKVGALTSWLLRRAPAAQAANKCKSPMASAVISSLRAGPKSSASSVSGLSAVSGQSLSKLPAYCYKGANGYYANNYSQHQHLHYQHPPTADLLGTGYQCQQQQSPPRYPVYHIATGNNSQTTRLIWNNGNGTSPDGFTIDGGSYMPLSNAPRSDSGSVYQTIY